MFAKGILKTIPDNTLKVSEQLPESVYEELRIYHFMGNSSSKLSKSG